MSFEAYMSREYFYVGGQMYTEHLIPSNGVSQPYPIVFIHGGAQTGTNWLNKPDGGRGWASYFLDKGYRVYIVDTPQRARSSYWNATGQQQITADAERIESKFTAISRHNEWPSSKLHTQWPGTGTRGDPIFDAYLASTVPFCSTPAVHQADTQRAGAALLDKIGPAILLGHSQGGANLWAIADIRPKLVKALSAVEPQGPPFQERLPLRFNPAKKWGIAEIPIHFSNPGGDPLAPLSYKTVPHQGAADEVKEIILQDEPARKMTNVCHIPVLVVTAEASYHKQDEINMILFLQQAGVNVEWMALWDIGIHGNGHMCFMEKNSDDIALALHNWVSKTVLEGKR